MSIAYLYSRYSSPAQAKGDSTRRQLDAATQYAEVHGLTLDTSLRDHGISGFTGENRVRGALGSFLKRIEAGEIAKGSYLLVDSIDRLSRESINQVANMLSAITLAGTKIVNLSDGHVFDEGADLLDWMRFLIHAERANAESKEKGRKVSQAREAERQRAREHKTPSTSVGPHWLELIDGKWQEIPDRVATMRRIFNMREEGVGYNVIVQTLNTEKVPTATGRGHWASATVCHYLSSRTVLGEYQPCSAVGGGRKFDPVGDPIEGYYPPIIEVDQFYRVQSIASGRRHPRAAPRTNTFKNLLVGLVTCRSCGSAVGYIESSFPNNPHWKVSGVLKCNGVIKGLCNNRARIPYLPLEADLLRLVTTLPLLNRTAPDQRLERLRELEGALTALDVKIEALLDHLEAAGQLAAQRLRTREEERRAFAAEIEQLRAETSPGVVTTFKDKQQALVALTSEMTSATGDKLFALRATISAALKRFALAFEMDGGQIAIMLDASQVSAPRRVTSGITVQGMLDASQSRLLRWELTNEGARVRAADAKARNSARLD